MADEMTVVWNGAHGGMDRDLLCVQLLPRTRAVEAPKLTRRLWKMVDMVPLDQGQALTTREIMARTGATYSTVSQALFRLRQRGLLRWDLVSGPVGKGQRPRVYWRMPQKVAA